MTTRREPSSSSAFALILIVSLFFLWGAANNLNDILIKHFKKTFELSDFKAGLVQSAFYLGYFCFAIPAGYFMHRYGYKGAIVFGLSLFALGAFLFYPAAEYHAYPMFLLSLYVIASGLAFLETSANPLVTVLGDPASAVRRLNMAQAFNPLGSMTGVLVGQHYILSGVEPSATELAGMSSVQKSEFYIREAHAVQVPYVVIGAIAIVLAILVLVTRFPGPREQDPRDTALVASSALSRLVTNSIFMQSVLAQFFYVGAQVGVWSYLIRYTQSTIPSTPERVAASFLTASLLAFMVGRFAGSALLRYARPHRLLGIYSAINMSLCGTAVFLPGEVGLYALIGCSFFMSIMFPTIFALGLDGLTPGSRKLGSSLLVMSIIGGAILTAVMGATSDAFGIQWAMLIPLGCFGYIFFYAMRVMTCRQLVTSKES